MNGREATALWFSPYWVSALVPTRRSRSIQERSLSKVFLHHEISNMWGNVRTCEESWNCICCIDGGIYNEYIYIGFTRKTIKENNPRIHQNVDTINQL